MLTQMCELRLLARAQIQRLMHLYPHLLPMTVVAHAFDTLPMDVTLTTFDTFAS